ncbi:CAP family protein [Streptomyces sp. NPDC087850]
MPDATTDTFLQEVLTTANAHRARHHTPPLTLDPALTSYAKSRAQLISQKEGLSHGHAGLRAGTGETLFWGGSSRGDMFGGRAAVDVWYNEVASYDFDRPGYSPTTGSFTQLVWKGTTRIGAARAFGAGTHAGETYIVVNYEKQGNMAGAFEGNVPRP